MYTVQPSFSGGEFSPSLQSRTDIQKYQTGLKKAKNFIIHPHGGASNRPGTQFLRKAKFTSKKTRILPFEFSLDQSYVLEFGDLYVRFFKDGGLIVDGASVIYEVVTPYTENDIASLKVVQSADVLFIFHKNYPIKRLTRYSDASWTLDNMPIINGPFMPNPSNGLFAISPTAFTTDYIVNTGTAVDLIAVSGFFTVADVGSLIKARQFIQSERRNDTFSANGNSAYMLPVKGTWRFTSRGVWAGVITIKRNNPSTLGSEVIRTFSHNSTDANIDANGFEEDLCYISVEMSGYASGPCYSDISCDSYYQDCITQVTGFVDTYTATGVLKTELIRLTPILSWQEGSWSDKRGYPTCGGFYQDRFIAASTESEKQTVWTSKTGNYIDFGVTSPLEDTDAVTANLPSRKMNAIKNLVALSEILAFTSASECGIGEIGGVFSPTTVKTRVFGYRGSSEVDPVIVGNRAIFVQAMGSVVRDFGYEYASDGYSGTDLSIFSSHLLRDFNIVSMAYQQEPDSIVWLVRSDGKLLSMTYMKEQDIISWTWHETDGLFESVCSIPGDGQNDIYFVINRDGERFIEKLTKRLAIPTSEESFFVDSGLTYRGVPTSTISGLNHLNGKEVVALADGRVVKNLLVASGAVTLPVQAVLVHIGLPYESDLETLEIQLPTQDGTSYGRFTKVSEAQFSFLNSRGGSIGPDADNLDQVQELLVGGIGDVKPLFTGEYRQSMASGYERGGRVFYRQSEPLPVTILSIVPKVNLGDQR